VLDANVNQKGARKMSTYNVKMEGSEQERQLLEVLRDHGIDAASDFRLLVQKQDGAWVAPRHRSWHRLSDRP